MTPLLYGFSIVYLLVSVLGSLQLSIWCIRWIQVFRPFLVLPGSMLILLLYLFVPPDVYKGTTLVFIGLAVLSQLSTLLWFSPLVKKEVPDATPSENDFSFMELNLLKTNQNFPALTKLVRDHKPDVILFIEYTSEWQDYCSSLHSEFPFRIEYSNDTGFGIALFSKFKLETKQIRFLENPEIPSLDVVIALTDRRKVRIIGTHPSPPVPWTRSNTLEKDMEAFKIAELLENEQMPILVSGDFNDVPWSIFMNQFHAKSKLRDPRVGRGLYPTWHASYFIRLLPLDHILLSEHFHLADFQRLHLQGSDHWGLKAKLIVR